MRVALFTVLVTIGSLFIGSLSASRLFHSADHDAAIRVNEGSARWIDLVLADPSPPVLTTNTFWRHLTSQGATNLIFRGANITSWDDYRANPAIVNNTPITALLARLTQEDIDHMAIRTQTILMYLLPHLPADLMYHSRAIESWFEAWDAEIIPDGAFVQEAIFKWFNAPLVNRMLGCSNVPKRYLKLFMEDVLGRKGYPCPPFFLPIII